MSDISFAIRQALRHNRIGEGHNYLDASEAHSLVHRAGYSSVGNAQLRNLRGQIETGQVRADHEAVHALDRKINSFYAYTPDYRRPPMSPMPPAPRYCDRTGGGVVRDAVVGGIFGAIVGGVIGGDSGAAVGGTIGGLAGATRRCD